MDVVWFCLLLAGGTLGQLSDSFYPPPCHGPDPCLLNCTFLHGSNVTCCWTDPGWPGLPDTNPRYTLLVQRIPSGEPTATFNCTTSTTECTADILGAHVSFNFCMSILAHGPGRERRSAARCQIGKWESKLPPLSLNSVVAVTAEPQCLQLNWTKPTFPTPTLHLTDPELVAGHLSSQIEFTHGKETMLRNVCLNLTSLKECGLRPWTMYSIRLRLRLSSTEFCQGPWSVWSDWGPALSNSTAEASPSQPPSFWRQVNQKGGGRNVTLLWKPFHDSVAHGRIKNYNVSCHRGDNSALTDLGSCGVVGHNTTSCLLFLRPGSFSCSVTAINSVGVSPGARIELLSYPVPGLPPLTQTTVIPLDDNSLVVQWTAPANQSVNSFVVEWSAVTSKGNSHLYWERLNASIEEYVIKGVEPYILYAVQVTAVNARGGTVWAAELSRVYTRQGVPSAGPKVEIRQTAQGKVLTWSRLPEEEQHGHIRNYTVYYNHNEITTSETVPGDVLWLPLKPLVPERSGAYVVYMKACTDAGLGVAGPNVTVTPEELGSLMKYLLLPLSLTTLLLPVLGVLVHRAMLRVRPAQYVPDASKSSLAHWTPTGHPLEKTKWLPVMEHVPNSESEIPLVLETADRVNTGLLHDTTYPTMLPGPYNPRPLLCSWPLHGGGTQPAHCSGDLEQDPGGAPEPDYKRPHHHAIPSGALRILLQPPQSALPCNDHYTPAAPSWAAETIPPLGGGRELQGRPASRPLLCPAEVAAELSRSLHGVPVYRQKPNPSAGSMLLSYSSNPLTLTPNPLSLTPNLLTLTPNPLTLSPNPLPLISPSLVGLDLLMLSRFSQDAAEASSPYIFFD